MRWMRDPFPGGRRRPARPRGPRTAGEPGARTRRRGRPGRVLPGERRVPSAGRRGARGARLVPARRACGRHHARDRERCRVFRETGGADYCALDYSLSLLRRHLAGRRRVCASAECVPRPASSCRFVVTIAALEHVPPGSRVRGDRSRPGARRDRVRRAGVALPRLGGRRASGEALSRPRARAEDPEGVDPRSRFVALPRCDGGAAAPWRRIGATLRPAPTALRFRPLEANYGKFWMADSDACASIDSHEGVLFFETRGYELLRPRGGTRVRVLFRAGALVVRKPASPARPSSAR